MKGVKSSVIALLILGIIFLVIFSSPRTQTDATVDQKDVTGAEALPIIGLFFAGLGIFAFAVGKYYPHNEGKRR